MNGMLRVLSDDDLARFANDGVLVVPQAVPPENLRDVIDAAFAFSGMDETKDYWLWAEACLQTGRRSDAHEWIERAYAEMKQTGCRVGVPTSSASPRSYELHAYVKPSPRPSRGPQGQGETCRVSLYRENGHTVIQCNIRDITERKALEKALHKVQAADKRIALALQRPMLFHPKEDAFSGLLVQTAYATASDDTLVGGDFWDTFAYDNGHVAFVLGDVMGHGLTSAIFTTELKHTLRGYIREHEQPSRILFQMNQFLCQTGRLFQEGINTEGGDAPVCLVLAIIERGTGNGTFALAGMEPPLLARANGKVTQLAAVGMPLGVAAGENYTHVDFPLEADDTLILFTDGITEARQGQAVSGNGRANTSRRRGTWGHAQSPR